MEPMGVEVIDTTIRLIDSVIVLVSDHGSSDDKESRVEGVYSDLEQAKKAMKSINRKYERMKKIPKGKEDLFDKLNTHMDSSEAFKYTDKEWDFYLEVSQRIRDANDYKGCTIQKFTLDKMPLAKSKKEE